MGRRGTLVDWAEGIENRPFLVKYDAESIINWQTGRIQGKTMLTLLMLWEKDARVFQGCEGDGTLQDAYAPEMFDQWREYVLLVDAQGHPYCVINVYRRTKPKSTGGVKREKGTPDFKIVEQFMPTRRGVPLDRIPFVFHNSHNSLPDVGPCPLLDIANLNISHYRTSADLEHGRRMTALPTPWAVGFEADVEQDTNGGIKKKAKEIQIGSDTILMSENDEAKCGYMEFSGAGLESLTKALEQKEGQMAALGARMLEPEAKKAEAFGTVEMRNVGETSALMAIALAVGESISEVLQLAAWWAGTALKPQDMRQQAQVIINTDFLTSKMAPEMLRELTACYMGGSIDWPTYFAQLKAGEIFGPEAEEEEVRANIERNPPLMLAAPEPEPDPATGGA